MSSYLVTGAAGFIGACVAKKLLEQGHRVVTIDNLSTGFESNLPAGVEFVFGDCSDPNVYLKIPQIQYDAIFHIAGQSSGEISFDDPIYDIKTNAESTLLLLKFALKVGCKRFVFASTMSVYGGEHTLPVKETDFCKPVSFYGVAKLASEQYLRIYESYGIKSTALRLFNVYGPGQNLSNLRQGMVSIFLAQLLQDKHILVKGAASRFRDFIFIDDVVDIFIGCLDNTKKITSLINVATGHKTTVERLVSLLSSFSKEEITVTYQGTTKGDINGIYANIETLLDSNLKHRFVSIEEGLKSMYFETINNKQ